MSAFPELFARFAHGANRDDLRLMEQAESELAKLQAERDAWRAVLQSLTPGGSEFTEPQECERFARDRDAVRWELLKRMKRERGAQQEAIAAAREILQKLDSLTNAVAVLTQRNRLFLLDMLGDEARAALDKLGD